MTITSLFTKFGFKPPTRDDLKWVYFQAIGASTLILANIGNLPAWAAYVGITLTTTEIHQISVVATIILFLGGKYGKSDLPKAKV